jgi:hypothetical protein
MTQYVTYNFAPAPSEPMQRLLADLSNLTTAAAPKVGDLVTATVTGHVSYIDDDGDLYLHANREPFPDEVDTFACIPSANAHVITPAAAKPRIGDTVTGRQVRETPWQRGTVLREDDDRFILGADGMWTSANDGERYAFTEIWDIDTYVVEYLPGTPRVRVEDAERAAIPIYT